MTGARVPARRAQALGGAPGARGLSFVEVLIAASILVVALLGIAGAFPSALLQVTAGGQMTKATGLAHQMMEAVRSDPSYYITKYAGVSTDAPENFPADTPSTCASPFDSGDRFCGNTKLTQWARDVAVDSGDGRPLARGRGTISVVDHENPVPGGGAAVSGTTTMLRITVTVGWDDTLGRRQVTITSTVACNRPRCD